MGNPFDEARQEKLKEDSLEFLKQFGIQYGKAFGVSLFEKIKAQQEQDSPDARRLLYRPCGSSTAKRSALFRGACYMKEGEGQGAFGKWKKVYVAERSDYNIDIFKSEGDCQANKKPKATIKVAGYKFTKDPTYHFKQQIRSLAGPLELDDEAMAFAFSPFSWALTHFARTNYIFQLHKGKDPFCSCFGGSVVEPEDAGSENAGEREKWCEWMQNCTSNASARDIDSPHGKAFDKCVKGLAISLKNLNGFSDDGTEAEILVDMLMMQVLMPMRDDILRDIQVPAMMKLPVWYKTKGLIMTILCKIVEPAWNKIAEGVNALTAKIEAPIKQGIEQILKAKQAIKDKVQVVVADRISQIMSKMLTPFLKPVFQVFERPVRVSFDISRDIYARNVDYYVKKGLPSNKNQRNSLLDQIPQNEKLTKDIKKNCKDLIKPIQELTKLSAEIFGDLDANALKSTTEDEILKTLDAAVYTFEVRLTEAGPQEAAAVYQQVLEDYQHDIQLARAACVKKVMKVLVYDKIMVGLEPTVGSAVDDLDNMIPEPMKDFVTVRSNYEEFCEMMFQEPIDKMVQAAYPA